MPGAEKARQNIVPLQRTLLIGWKCRISYGAFGNQKDYAIETDAWDFQASYFTRISFFVETKDPASRR